MSEVPLYPINSFQCVLGGSIPKRAQVRSGYRLEVSVPRLAVRFQERYSLSGHMLLFFFFFFHLLLLRTRLDCRAFLDTSSSSLLLSSLDLNDTQSMRLTYEPCSEPLEIPQVARGSYPTPSKSKAPTYWLQGYLAHKKQRLHTTLQ